MNKKVMKSRFAAILTIMVFIASLFSFTGTSATAADQQDKSRVIVILDDGVSKKSIKDYVNKKGGEITADFNIVNGMAVFLDNDKIAGLKGIKGVKEVGLDVKVYASDTELDNSWGVNRIGAGSVHDLYTGANVNVAVIDTGIYYPHSDLDGNYRGGYDFVNKDNDPLDDNGHGTHVAGIIAAEDNNSGVVGVAPQASLYALKALDASGSGYVSDIIEALDWCCDNDIQVINMSLGSTSDAVGFQAAIGRAYEAGIVIVAAAGNSGKSNGKGDSIEYPARYEEVIAVGAVDRSDTRAYFSSTGPLLELSAPGVSVISCYPGGYASASGTSMASPHVAGTAALILAANPGISNTGLRQLMQATADDLGSAGKDTLYGYGLVDADEVVLPANSGSISGTVSDSNSFPIANALVSCGDGTVSTDSSGYYMMADLNPGTYTVTASAQGYQEDSQSITVDEGEISIANFTLTPVVAEKGIISGIVRNESGLGIAGAMVSTGSHTVAANADGSYIISDIIPGDYTLTASAAGYVDSSREITVYATQTTAADFILTAADAEQQTVVKNIVYSTSGGKTGTAHLIVTPIVVDGSDLAVPNALITIEVTLNGMIYYTGSAITGTTGTVSFKLAAAPSGTYATRILDVQAAGHTWDGVTPINAYIK